MEECVTRCTFPDDNAEACVQRRRHVNRTSREATTARSLHARSRPLLETKITEVTGSRRTPAREVA